MTQLYTSDTVCYILQAIFKKKKEQNYCGPLLSLFIGKEMANILKKSWICAIWGSYECSSYFILVLWWCEKVLSQSLILTADVSPNIHLKLLQIQWGFDTELQKRNRFNPTWAHI